MGDMSSKKQKNRLLQLYSIFAAGLFLQFVPDAFLGIMSACLLCTVLIASYVFRYKSQGQDLQHNHTTYIIRTFWIGSLYLLIGILAASVLVYPQIDHTPVTQAVDEVMAGNTNINTNAIMMNLFWANKNLLLFIGIPLIAPGILFFIYRCVYGTSRVIKGYRVPNPYSWL